MKRVILILGLILTLLPLKAQILDHSVGKARKWQRTDFTVRIAGEWENPYLQEEVTADIVLTAPSGKVITVPCFFTGRPAAGESTWSARFLPQEKGRYTDRVVTASVIPSPSSVIPSPSSVIPSEAKESPPAHFRARRPRCGSHGILHPGDNWVFRYDDGTPFRGVGENLCWESRENDDSKFFKELHERHERYNYDVMLPLLAENGVNFTRFWMCSWNFPIDRHDDFNNLRYSASDEYFNPSAVERLDHVLSLAESLGVKVMLCLGPGDVVADRDFFVSDEAKARYRNYLRYIVAHWAYSPSIGAWEFFNEIDNVQFSDPENPIPAEDIVAWHREMAAYLKSIDPYGHIVTTSISHRDLEGLNDIPDIDVNQKHIYCATSAIPETILDYETRHGKPYIIGEFGYEWDWSKNFDNFAEGMETDFRRGLWYGLFNPTPVAPMSWWWEWFDNRGMISYFRNVRRVSDRMLKAGKGRFEPLEVKADGAEAFAVRCGARTWVYVFNPGPDPVTSFEVDLPKGRKSKSVNIPPGEEALFEIK